MNYIHVLFSSYVIVSCIFYSTEQAIDILLLDLVFLSEGKIYTIDAAALAAINKFIIKYGYGVTE